MIMLSRHSSTFAIPFMTAPKNGSLSTFCPAIAFSAKVRMLGGSQ